MLTTEEYSVPAEDRQEYQEHVAALFTAPIMKRDQLLANLTKYWPGEASETLPGLVAERFIERTPTGRYRLPLLPGTPGFAAHPAAAARATPAVPAPAPTVEEPQPVAPVVPRSVPAAPPPQFKPLRLTKPAVAPFG